MITCFYSVEVPMLCYFKNFLYPALFDPYVQSGFHLVEVIKNRAVISSNICHLQKPKSDQHSTHCQPNI